VGKNEPKRHFFSRNHHPDERYQFRVGQIINARAGKETRFCRRNRPKRSFVPQRHGLVDAEYGCDKLVGFIRFDATIGIHPTAAEEFVTLREKRVVSRAERG